MKKDLKFKIVDVLLIILTVLPLVAGMVLSILTKPASEGIEITGAMIYCTIPFPIQDLPITESQVNSLLVTLFIAGLCLFLTHGMKSGVKCKRHLLAEWIVEKTDILVNTNMGELFYQFSPFIAAILGLSAFSSLFSLLGLYPPTSDFNIICGWSVAVFILITHYKLKGGLWNYIKGFGEPLILFAPMNVISEFSTPLAMAFRHYGNVLSGSVISTLVLTALAGLSAKLLGWLPEGLNNIPLFQIGIPAVLSIYFDVFSGCLQAFIFAMLTMMNIGMAFPEDLWRKRMEKRKAKKAKKALKHDIKELHAAD